MVVGVLAVASAVFVLLWVMPGSPFTETISLSASPRECRPIGDFLAEYRSFVSHWGLFDPAGCAGQSRVFPGSAIHSLVVGALPVTFFLVACAMAGALFVGASLGAAAAYWPSSLAPRLCHGLHSLGIAVPNVVLGPLVVLACSLQLGWLPPALAAGPASWILPAITLGMACAGGVADVLHRSLRISLWSPPVLLAKAQQASRWQLMTKYAARDAVLPVLASLGPSTSGLLAGTLIVERLFSLPGLGSLFVSAALGFDLGLVSALVLVYSSLYLTAGLVQDVLYGVLDPRVRFDV